MRVAVAGGLVGVGGVVTTVGVGVGGTAVGATVGGRVGVTCGTVGTARTVVAVAALVGGTGVEGEPQAVLRIIATAATAKINIVLPDFISLLL